MTAPQARGDEAVVAACEPIHERDLRVWGCARATAEVQEERNVARVDRGVGEAHHLWASG